MGALNAASDENPHAVVARLASLTGNNAAAMPVPFIANTVADRDVLLAQQAAREAAELAAQADLMVVGIGTTGQNAELVATGMIAPEEMAEIAAAGGVGEMLGHFFDRNGQPVGLAITDRILTQPLDQLRSRRIVAIAGGTTKSAAISAVLNSGLLSGLIIDEHAARTIADQQPPTAPSTDTETFDMTDGNTTKTPAARRLLASAFGKNTNLVQILLEGRAFFALIAIIAIFSLLSPNYATLSNFLIMANHVGILGLLSIGMLLVILNDGIDLSVGSVLGLTGVFGGFLSDGLVIIGVSSWQTVFTGAAIVLAAMLNSIQYGGAAKRS